MKSQLCIISALTAAAQLAAFFKLWFSARLFGLGSELDSYNLALVLPSLISGVLAGILQTGLFPVRAQLNAQASPETVHAFERFVLWTCAAIGIATATALVLATSALVPLLAGSATAAVRTSLALMLPMMSMLIALNTLGDCAGYMLAMRQRFWIAAAAPVANGLLGGLMLAVWPEGGVANLLLGTLLGLALQVGICLCGLKYSGFPFTGSLPAWSLVRERGKEMLRLGGWILPGVVLSNLVISLPPVWMASFGEGAVSAYAYAYRLHSSALQLLVMTGSTIILSHFSQLIAQRQLKIVQHILFKSAIASAVVGASAVLLVWFLGAPTLTYLFGGRFDSAVASRVSSHWLLMTLGLGFAMLSNVHAKLWQAQSRPAWMSVIAIVSLSTLFLGYLLLRPFAGELAAAGALTISSVVTLAIGLNLTRLSWGDYTKNMLTSRTAGER